MPHATKDGYQWRECWPVEEEEASRTGMHRLAGSKGHEEEEEGYENTEREGRLLRMHGRLEQEDEDMGQDPDALACRGSCHWSWCRRLSCCWRRCMEESTELELTYQFEVIVSTS